MDSPVEESFPLTALLLVIVPPYMFIVQFGSINTPPPLLALSAILLVTPNVKLLVIFPPYILNVPAVVIPCPAE